ncbi:conserved oligomeric Golgi complex subunit 1 [Euwallacea fornicatus]|uniref:conserved oligomeric Golgi complex subunit 1 n=1 Tax=Euwallacea fornicatus TaxID=995702 RepID=UPI0033900A26
MNRSDLINLDVNKLFEEHSVDEIVEIEKLLDGEIERKRNDLRSMVGDRYKDILAASDAIKSMKTISENIVSSIDEITKTCEMLVDNPNIQSSLPVVQSVDQRQLYEERVLLIQVRLAIFLNEKIWTALDQECNLDATQYYLLAQHIYMGLNLTKKEYLSKLVLLDHLQLNLSTLRNKIFQQVTEKLQSVEITAEETSQNLNALMLIANQTHGELLSIFIEHRKTALKTVINSQYSSVRLQISAMVKCLITTVLLLHNCFIYNDNKSGLLWEQICNIIGENAPPTLSKLDLPVTPLVAYIPDIIRQFRPKLSVSPKQPEKTKDIDKSLVEGWLKSTQEAVDGGLQMSLQLVTTVKGLYLVREESLKIELSEHWFQVCTDLHLPDNFNVWYYFFQKLLTARAKALISNIVINSLTGIKNDIKQSLENGPKTDTSELDLRWYVWKEQSEDVSKSENCHTGLTMKSKGYSRSVVSLCDQLDQQFLALLKDVSQYLYGQEYNLQTSIPYLITDYKFKRKFIDKEELENYLMSQCTTHSLEIPAYIFEILTSENVVAKSIFCARFLQACCSLCTSFRRCCEFAQGSSEWLKVCDTFTKTSHKLWKNWVDDCVLETTKRITKLDSCSPKSMISTIARWDDIEIQEQTEDKVFKSQIKVPLKPGIPLTHLLVSLNRDLAKILPYTLPKPVHIHFIESNMEVILKEYDKLASRDLNQTQALQYLFDVRFLATVCVPRENNLMVNSAQIICDKLRAKIDPFDLDVFYSYLQNNVKKAVSQSQSLFGCLLPSTTQLINLGAYKKPKEQEKDPSLMALSTPSSSTWFPLLPITVPSQKMPGSGHSQPDSGSSPKPPKSTLKKSSDPASVMRQSAVSLFGNFSTDWFS